MWITRWGLATSCLKLAGHSTTTLLTGAGVALDERFDVSSEGPASALVWAADDAALAAVGGVGSLICLFSDDGAPLGSAHRNGFDLGDSLEVLNKSQVIFGADSVKDPRSFLHVWDLESGATDRSLPGEGTGTIFALSPDAQTLAVAHGLRSVSLYSTRSWREDAPITLPDVVSVLKFVPDGKSLLMGSATGELYVKDRGRDGLADLGSPFRRQLRPDIRIEGIVSAMAASPDGRQVALGVGVISSALKRKGVSGASDHPHVGTEGLEQQEVRDAVTNMPALQVINLQSGTVERECSGSPASPIRAVAWDPKNRFILVSDAQADVWDCTPTLGSKMHLLLHSDSPLTFLSISPSGDRLAVTSRTGARIFTIRD